MCHYTHAFLKSEGDNCYRLRPSVLPLYYLFLNHWTKSNQSWCVSFSHECCVQQHFFWTRHLGPWGGVKWSNIIKFQFQSQFQRFLYQTLCVFSHEWMIQIISGGIYIMLFGSCPRDGAWGVGVKRLFFPNMVMWHIKLEGMIRRTEYKWYFHRMVKLMT